MDSNLRKKRFLPGARKRLPEIVASQVATILEDMRIRNILDRFFGRRIGH